MGLSRIGLLRLLRALAEGDLERLRRAVAIDTDAHDVTWLMLEEEVEQRVLLVDSLPAELGDDVSRLDAGLGRGAALDNLDNALAIGGRLALQTHVRPDDLALIDQLRGRLADGIPLDGEGHIGRAGVGAHRARADAGGVDAD